MRATSLLYLTPHPATNLQKQVYYTNKSVLVHDSQGYLRKAGAYEGLQQWQSAVDTYKSILALDSNPDSADAKKQATVKVKQLQEKLAGPSTSNLDRKAKSKSQQQQSAVQHGFLAGKRSSSIYNEKEDLVKEIVDAKTGATRVEDSKERSWRFMLRRLKDGCNMQGVNANGERVVLDDGVFAKLLQESEFQKLVYPGIPKQQLVHAPQNLQALLEDPWYEEELLALMPKVEAKAESVLKNVKVRGAAQGEFMDAATEAKLRPQVLQEAFGREVLVMVHRVNYKKHMMMANDVRTLADPNAECAEWDQLSSAFLDALLLAKSSSVDGDDPEAKVAGVAVMDDFMGEEWTEILLADVQRMATNNLLMETALGIDSSPGQRDLKSSSPATASDEPISTNGRMRFLEQSDCQREYPAVAELLEKLHALPFEINKKRNESAKLCAQFAHCTSLHQLRRGESQRLRLDCGAGENDNGFKLTCVYFFNSLESISSLQGATTLNLRTSLLVDAAVKKIEPVADRLVVFKSQSVFNQITAVQSEHDELFYLTFWIHGKELR